MNIQNIIPSAVPVPCPFPAAGSLGSTLFGSGVLTTIGNTGNEYDEQYNFSRLSNQGMEPRKNPARSLKRPKILQNIIAGKPRIRYLGNSRHNGANVRKGTKRARR